MPTERHALILGSTGFIGQALLHQLENDPTIRLTILCHRQTPRPLAPKTRIVRGHLGSFDLSWSAKDPPDWIFHCARLRGSGITGRMMAAWRGRTANRRLIKRLITFPKPPRVIYVSGSLMYGHHADAWVDETTPMAPVSFAREYALAERPFLTISPRQLSVTLARPGWVLGDGSWFRWFYLDPSQARQAVPVYGDATNWMSIIHREDCATLLRSLAAQAFPERICNLALGEPLRQQAFAEMVAAELNCGLERIPARALRQSFDGALETAFTSSIRLRSLYTECFVKENLRFRDSLSAVRAVVAEHKAHIRPSTKAACD